jgi:hypothetical protein
MAKVLVKLNAPVRIDGLLGRDTFDVPHNDAGLDFMTWWGKAASDERDTVLKMAHVQGVCVTEALAAFNREKDE